MPRILGGVNTMILQDNLSDGEIHLKYRMPSPKEIISYRNGGTRREKNKLVYRTGENRLEHGLKILVGIRDKDFFKIVNGDAVPISSDPKSKDYDPDWKKQIEDLAPDLVEILAVQVFDASIQVMQPDDVKQGEEEDEDDLPGNS